MIIKRRPNFHIVVAVCALALFLLGTAQAGDKMLTKQLMETIAKINTGKGVQIQEQTAQDLFELTRKQHQNIDDRTIRTIVSLLDAPDDSVRYWVARSLGNFGPRASMAAPKLKQLLAEAECIEFGKNSAGGIRLALEQMGITPPPRNCGN
jgi:hypothetical protein